MTFTPETETALRATLQQRVDAEALVSDISRRLLALPASRIDAEITDSLGRVGRFLGADAVSLLQICDDGTDRRPTHVWLDHTDARRPANGHSGARAAAWVPVGGNGRVVGSLDLVWRDREADDVATALEALRILGDVFLVALERKRAEEALRESEHRFHAIVDATSDMIAVLEPDGTVRYVSPAVEHVLGWPVEDKLGTNAFDDVHPDDRARVRKHFTSALAVQVGRTGPPTAFRLRHHDGSWRHVEAVASNLIHDQAVGGIVVSTRDISERTRLEEELLQSHKLEAVGRLAGGVAHDFNNLLTAIAGYTALALDRLEPGHAAERDVVEIEHAATRAAELVDQLLAFSRRKVIRPSVLDLNDVVRSMDPILQRLAGPSVHLDTRLKHATAGVRADRTQLEQIIVNLVVNAVDACNARGDTSGHIVLSTGSARIAPRTTDAPGVLPGRYWVLRVADDGPGMDAETRAHAFEPFFTTKAPGRGTGLGLSTVYGIATQAGGHVTITSRPGAGTTVRVYLPVVGMAATLVGPEPAAPVTMPGGNETVLVIEDEPAVRTLASSVLRRLGYTVLTAADDNEAFGVSTSHDGPIDLLVTDVWLPRSGGKSAASLLASSRPGLPVLLVSEGTDLRVEPAPVLAERVEFLAKPFRPHQLARRVREILDTGKTVV